MERWELEWKANGGTGEAERRGRVVKRDAKDETQQLQVGLPAVLGAATGSETGQGALRALWQQLVTLWLDRDLVLGVAYQQASGAAGSKQGSLQILARRRAVCSAKTASGAPAPGVSASDASGGGVPTAAQPKCVLLELLLRPRARGLAQEAQAKTTLMIEALRAWRPELAESEIKLLSLEPEQSLELLTDPKSLLPLRLVRRSYLRAQLAVDEGSKPIEVEQLLEERFEFEQTNPAQP